MKATFAPSSIGHLRRAALLAALLTAVWLTAAARSSGVAGAAPPAATLEVQTVEMSDAGVRLAVTFPAATLDAAGNVTIAGLDTRLAQPGAPALPLYSAWVAVPPGADVTVDVITSGETRTAAPTLALAPAELDTTAWAAMMGETADNGTAAAPQPPAGIYPAALYTLSEPQYLRDLRLVQLRLFPIRYDTAGNALLETRRFDVTLRFAGAKFNDLHPAPAARDDVAQTLAGEVINFAQAAGWRSLPDDLAATGPTALPLNRDLFKIAVNADGVYEITYAQLQAAGMNVAAVDPNQLEMMVRGQPQAYEWVGNSNNVFEPAEKIRFVGLAFRGSRAEKSYVADNIYWLWAGGTPTRVQTVANQANQGLPAVTSFRSTVTAEPENYFFTTWTADWPTFADEPDSWYWDFIEQKTTNPTIKRDYTINLPYPVVGGPTATVVGEFMSREAFASPPGFTYSVRGAIKGNAPFGNKQWQGIKSVRVDGTIPSAQLKAGANTVEFEFMTNASISATPARMYLNRISIAYQRELRTSGNALLFTESAGGQREMRIAGFTTNDPAGTLVYNLSNPRVPVRIAIGTGDVAADGGFYTVKVGSSHAAGTEFYATTTANAAAVKSLSKYRAADLRPANGRGAWLAIAHPDLLAAAQQLAAHRAAASDLSTHVVAIGDVINQYGYGLPLPEAIRNFLRYAVANWTEGPRYVVLFGDATVNPRNLDCPLQSVDPGGCSTWNASEANMLLTDLPFVDRFNGMIPSDFTFSLLSGNDLLPDLAIGRIPAKTPVEAAAVVAKIVTYETQRSSAPQGWQYRLLFVADNADGGGNFCAENQQVAGVIPATYSKTHLCLAEDTGAAKTELRLQMSAQLVTGLSVFNYRGHGSVSNWGNGILESTNLDFWLNDGKPVVLISADCLDGFFTWPNRPGLGEEFLKKLPNRGSAAHWSSAGLGYTVEHTVLHEGFYNAIFRGNRTAAGDAVNYAKVQYLASNGHPSEAYSFNLLGDPAMKVLNPGTKLYLPAIRRP